MSMDFTMWAGAIGSGGWIRSDGGDSRGELPRERSEVRAIVWLPNASSSARNGGIPGVATIFIVVRTELLPQRSVRAKWRGRSVVFSPRYAPKPLRG